MDIFTLYYLVATSAMISFIWTYKRNLFALLLIIMAFSGTINFWIPNGKQLINILTTLLVSYLMIANEISNTFQIIKFGVITFVIFSIYFVLDNILFHNDNLLFVFSQYSKYYVPFAVLLLFIHYGKKDRSYLYMFNKLIGDLILVQIGISIYKFFLFGGHFWEGMVGTFGALRGGGSGTAFPLVALSWVTLNSNMNLHKWKSWIFIAGLLLVGVAAGKRAVILLFPILFLLLSIFISKKIFSRRILFLILLAPILFYFGVRLTPTFNPENKVWGSFDLEYMLKFTENYSMGKVDDGETRENYTGRVGSAIAFWNIFIDTENYSTHTLFGKGVEYAYTSASDVYTYAQFGRAYGLNHRGDVTGILLLYTAIGVVGVLLLITYYWFLFKLIRYKRLRFILFCVIMFDFIFYNSTMIRDPFVSSLMMFVIVYSLIQYSPKGQYSNVTHPFFR